MILELLSTKLISFKARTHSVHLVNAMNHYVQIQLFGNFALYFEEKRVSITSQRLQGLLAYIALHRTEPQTRQHIAFLIWPDSSEGQAHTNLRTLLHRFQTTLPNIAQLLRIDTQIIAWQPNVEIGLDVTDFETSVLQAQKALEHGDKIAAFNALENAVTYYKGDLLPDCYDEWVLSERERLSQILLDTLEKIVALLEQSRNYTAAIAYTRRLISFDPLNEAVYLRLINLYVLNGERASGLRTYHSCVSVLQTELGIAPGKALRLAYEKLVSAENPPSFKAATTPLENSMVLIGREREWRQLQASVEVATAGKAHMVVLSGEAGIGKTRLSEELVRWSNRQGFSTAFAPCYAAEGDLAFAPVSILLRSDGLRTSLLKLDTEWLSDISRIAPDLFAENPKIPPIGPLTERWQRQRLFEALARAVLSTEKTTLLVIDDLQWCSRDSLEWIHFLLRFMTKTHLLLVGTVRVEEIGGNQPLTELFDQLRSEARLTEINLSPLNAEDTARLGAGVTGNQLSQDQASTLFYETEGNPLFVIETMRANFADDKMYPQVENNQRSPSTILPSKVQAVIERRINQLTPHARKVVEVAAVIGRSFTFEVLSQAVDLDEDTLVVGLDELWQRHILHEQGLVAYDFTHDKLRAVTYANLKPPRRRILHRRVAQALETCFIYDLDNQSGQIAAHYTEAGITAKAAAYYQRAGLYSRQLFAHDIALSQFQNAVKQLDTHADTERSEVFEQIGDLLHFIGKYTESREAWQKALENNINVPVARAHLYRKIGNAWRDQFHYDEALQAYDQAEVILGNHDESNTEWLCWAETNLDRANVHYWRSESTQMLDIIARIQPVLEQYGSLAQRARMHQITALALAKRDRFKPNDEAIHHAHAYLKIMQEVNNSDALAAAHFQYGGSLLWTSTRFEEAGIEMRKALDLAEQRGDVSLQARCLTYLTIIERRRNNIELVQSLVPKSLKIALENKFHDYIGAAYANIAWLAWKNRDFGAVHHYGQLVFNAWQQLSVRYAFEWIVRFPLMALALIEDNILEANSLAQALLDHPLVYLPDEISTAIEEAGKAASVENIESCGDWLEIVIKKASEHNYL